MNDGWRLRDKALQASVEDTPFGKEIPCEIHR
jgi:hypothetical protein